MYGNAIYPVHVVVLSIVSLQLSPSEEDDLTHPPFFMFVKRTFVLFF